MRRTSLAGLEVFLAIAREGSLRGAAASLGLGAPAVSHQLKTLEAQIGVTLFDRTTRSLELTAAGRTLLEGAEPAFAGLVAALEEARGAGSTRKGALRITLPWSAYRIVLAPHLADFRAAYPEIRLELSFNEALVDIVAGGFHAGMRLGDRLSPGMIATRLTPPLKGAYSASPGYLSQHGRPRHPRDLLAHWAIRYRFISTNRLADWQFVEGDREFAVDPPAALVFDSFQAVVQAALAGHGIGWSLRPVVAEELAAGRLETVLDAYTPEHPPFFLYYTEQNRRLELLRVLIDFLGERRG
ncbi:LysR family transcriptional regulator [Afifella sp. IM 167]|uniref:LysR family transcriptional regulator n=1 Tax=Afifella sp. IM 167 TaxID=2033586 RepID=UPI001CCB0A45|nr:LysR family transcriptional regulator [Afifella sp. IM 167]MBZ8133982.1 LysR family transcriptional regulator [Afifella sp. IM 167]